MKKLFISSIFVELIHSILYTHPETLHPYLQLQRCLHVACSYLQENEIKVNKFK